MPYVREFLKLHTFKGFIDKADRNSVEDFCHPPGAYEQCALVKNLVISSNNLNNMVEILA